MNLLVVITMMINYCQQGQRLEWFWFGLEASFLSFLHIEIFYFISRIFQC